jgi:hypothetical protein
VKKNGKFELAITGPLVITALTKQMYPTFQLKDIEQHFPEVSIFPDEYFNATDYRQGLCALTGKSYCIHRYQASWANNRKRKIVSFLRKIKFPFIEIIIGKMIKRMKRVEEKRVTNDT